MVYVVGTVPAAAAIQAPAIIDRANTQPAPAGSTIGFGVCDLLPRVTRYFPTALEMDH
jgi:choline dehydrogenase-like flavoprotein